MNQEVACRRVDFLLVGGGLASAKAAETLRQEGATGTVLLVSAEPHLPYHRPALSKRYLLAQTDESQILIHPPQFYEENHIELMLGTQVTRVDTDMRHVITAAGLAVHYKKLLIATGARPRRIETKGNGLRGIYTLRTREDCDAIRLHAARAKTAVVVGGSFLGMEVAMSLREMGLTVTVLESDRRVLRHLESDHLSRYFREYAEVSGIHVRLHDGVTGFDGCNDVSVVETASGARIPCELVIVCTGVQPDTGFLKGSGINLEAGRVLVDEQLCTSVHNVFAAGDVASFHDPVFQRRRHIEHWDNAIRQGRLAAMNMLGRRLRYDEVSYFFCEIGDIGFNVLGDPSGTDERIGRGSIVERSYAEFYLKDDIPRSLFSLGRPPGETRLAESLIRYRVNVRDDREQLRNPAIGLDQLAMQTVLILQGGGALGAFECGVVRALGEHGIAPDIVAGISIGALNGAIIAGNPHNAAASLYAFWHELQITTPRIPSEPVRHAMTALRVLHFGVPKFFRPKWFTPLNDAWFSPWNWTGLYDTAPMRELLLKYVDFSALKASPTRLLVGAVNVLTAELDVFDSYVDELTPEHILASGSLPPGFSWTFVDGTPYWDGGVVSNSPLDLVIDRCGPDGKRVFIVDLFSGEKALPTNLLEVMARRDEIVYAERVRNDLRVRELKDAYRGLVQSILHEVEPHLREKIRQRPQYIQLMGDGAPMTITRFVRKGPGNEPSSRDYDFSDVAIAANQRSGYEIARQVLAMQQATAAHASRGESSHPERDPSETSRSQV